MKYKDTRQGHIESMKNKQNKTINHYNKFMNMRRLTTIEPESEFDSIRINLGVSKVSLTEFEEAVSVKTNTSSSEQAKTTKDKTTKNQSILKHNKVNGFEKDIVNTLSEESTL